MMTAHAAERRSPSGVAVGKSACKSILVVEDETDLAGLICHNIEREDYVCRCAAAGDEAIESVAREPP